MDQADIFNGVSSDTSALKDARSRDGNDTSVIPAFVFGEELASIADKDERVIVLTADLGRSNRALDFAQRHPNRFFNMGIAEQNMVTVAAGMASCGYVPFAATFSSFAALLCCEQIRTDCAYPQLPVRIVGHHSGMSMGFYGTSHHSLEDLGITRTLAGLTVVCATDANHLRAILRMSMDYPEPMYIRLGRGRDPEVYDSVPEVQIPGSTRLRHGTDLTLIATGSTVSPAVEAADQLTAEGLSIGVIDMYCISPLDTVSITDAAKSTGGILTVEEANRSNGLGTAVGEFLHESGLASIPFVRHGVPDEHVPVGPPAALYSHYRLDAAGVVDVAKGMLQP